MNSAKLKYATSKQALVAVLLAFGLGFSFAFGFLPTAQSLQNLVGNSAEWVRQACVLGLGALFFFGRPRTERGPKDSFRLVQMAQWLVIPTVISWAFGRFQVRPSDVWQWSWILVTIPITEEALFRGWIMDYFEKLYPQVWMTRTNPLPVSLWAQAVAFSVWHIQTVLHGAVGFGLFQMAYTLGVGLWLGWLRNKSGGIAVPILAHVLLNLAAAV